MVLKLPLESSTFMVTATPLAFVGRGNCLYTYNIHSLILASDTAGTPFGKRAVNAKFLVPGEISVTVPFTTTVLPISIETSGALIVMALGPLPIAYRRS